MSPNGLPAPGRSPLLISCAAVILGDGARGLVEAVGQDPDRDALTLEAQRVQLVGVNGRKTLGGRLAEPQLRLVLQRDRPDPGQARGIAGAFDRHIGGDHTLAEGGKLGRDVGPEAAERLVNGGKRMFAIEPHVHQDPALRIAQQRAVRGGRPLRDRRRRRRRACASTSWRSPPPTLSGTGGCAEAPIDVPSADARMTAIQNPRESMPG